MVLKVSLNRNEKNAQANVQPSKYFQLWNHPHVSSVLTWLERSAARRMDFSKARGRRSVMLRHGHSRGTTSDTSSTPGSSNHWSTQPLYQHIDKP